jgi:polar amino acid transport system substrate-binding protein
MVGDRLTTEPYGVGIKEGDKQVKGFVDGVLKNVEADGRWEETYQKWVGRHIGREEQPPDMTLQEALELGS